MCVCIYIYIYIYTYIHTRTSSTNRDTHENRYFPVPGFFLFGTFWRRTSVSIWRQPQFCKLGKLFGELAWKSPGLAFFFCLTAWCWSLYSFRCSNLIQSAISWEFFKINQAFKVWAPVLDSSLGAAAGERLKQATMDRGGQRADPAEKKPAPPSSFEVHAMGQVRLFVFRTLADSWTMVGSHLRAYSRDHHNIMCNSHTSLRQQRLFFQTKIKIAYRLQARETAAQRRLEKTKTEVITDIYSPSIIYARKACILTMRLHSLCFHNMAPLNLILTFFGCPWHEQIESAHFPGEDNLYCQFSIQHGNDWQVSCSPHVFFRAFLDVVGNVYCICDGTELWSSSGRF